MIEWRTNIPAWIKWAEQTASAVKSEARKFLAGPVRSDLLKDIDIYMKTEADGLFRLFMRNAINHGRGGPLAWGFTSEIATDPRGGEMLILESPRLLLDRPPNPTEYAEFIYCGTRDGKRRPYDLPAGVLDLWVAQDASRELGDLFDALMPTGAIPTR